MGMDFKNTRILESFFCFRFENQIQSDWDLNLATHIEERLYTFGGPFAMFDDFTDSERDLSVLMMEQWGKFIKHQTVDWGQHPHHAYFDLNGLSEVDNEAHSHRFEPNKPEFNVIRLFKLVSLVGSYQKTKRETKLQKFHSMSVSWVSSLIKPSIIFNTGPFYLF